MRWLRNLATVVLLASAGPVQAAERATFGPGEQIRYEVSYLGVVAGLAQITVGWKMQQFGREVWPLVCMGQTTSVAKVVPVRDRFVSYWDPTAGRSLGADFFVDENHHKRRERYQYDTDAGKILLTRQVAGQSATERSSDAPPTPWDLVSAGFSLRNTALEVGAVHERPVFTGAKIFTMRAKVEAKEKLQSRLGEIEVYRVSVNGEFEGKLATRNNMTIFYTADERQFPVRMVADLLLGSVMADAVAYEPGRSSPRQSP